MLRGSSARRSERRPRPWPYQLFSNAGSYARSDDAGHALITHPFHPLRGRRVRIHDHVTVWNVTMVRYVADGPACPVLISIPVSWTSLRRVDDFERVASGRSLFRADDLVALREMVDSLLAPVGARNHK